MPQRSKIGPVLPLTPFSYTILMGTGPMNAINKTSAYLVRNHYSYCFRMHIPGDLQPIIGRKEIRRSLQTGQLGVAKNRSRMIAGKIHQLFGKLRSLGEEVSENL